MSFLDNALEDFPKCGRQESFRGVIAQIYCRWKKEPIRIVETGTIRSVETSHRMGEGWSTVLWGWWAVQSRSLVWTCDIDPKAIEVCKKVTVKYSERISYVVGDSVNFLKNFQDKIQVLYLDSLDTDNEDEIKIRKACEHQLREIEEAYSKLSKDALVVLDDIPFDMKKGKGELSIPFLLNRGWEVVQKAKHQVVLARMKY